MKKVSIFLFLVILLIISCERDADDYNLKVDRNLINDLYAKSDTKIIIGTQEYFLEAYLWRDFMPISPPDGKPLISINWLVSSDSTPIPTNISMVKQFVIKNDSVWIADYEIPNLTSPDYKLHRTSRNGPKWGPHITVDVISKLTDTYTKTDYYLKLPNVYISRTD
jgi:hypothetical protein